MTKLYGYTFLLSCFISSCSTHSESDLTTRSDNSSKSETYYQSIGQPQVADQIGTNAQTRDKNTSLLGASLYGVDSLITGEGASASCEQGHEDDRAKCRQTNKAKVDELNKSIRKHTEQ